MNSITIPFTLLWITTAADEYYYKPYNQTQSRLSGIDAYRSMLTLDWLAAEDNKQRELAAAFETEAAPPARVLTTECISYARPSTGKVARLMLELLKNLEGDNAKLIPELTHVLVTSKILVETNILESEPDLEALVKTPGIMLGEPHVTFPRILAMIWITISDPNSIKKYGWCPINLVTEYLAVNRASRVAKHMRGLEPIIARARFIMEDFIQSVTPLSMYQRKQIRIETKATPNDLLTLGKTVKRQLRYNSPDQLPPLPGTEQKSLNVSLKSFDEELPVATTNKASESSFKFLIMVVTVYLLK